MIHAIAVDDEIPALKLIELFCSKTEDIRLDKTFHIATEAFHYLQQFPADLIFLDIHMPSLSGMELHSKINPEIMVIFTTAYADHAVEGFNRNAVDYLLKPFSYKRFLQAVEKAKEKMKARTQQVSETSYLTIRSDYSLLKIKLTDILFAEGVDDYVRLHLKDQKPVLTRMTLKNLLTRLPEQEFVRVHRSWVVPLSRIESLRNKIISIAGQEIPLGSSYEADFLKSFNK